MKLFLFGWLIIIFLIGCSAGEPEIIFDFFNYLPSAQVKSERDDSLRARRTTLNLQTDIRDFIAQPTNTILTYYCNIPDDSFLRFGVGMDIKDWKKTTGVDLSISLTTVSGNEKVLFTKHLNPINNKDQWGWNDSNLDVSEYAGQIVRLDFRSSSSENDLSKVGWSRPQLLRTPDISKIQFEMKRSIFKDVDSHNIFWIVLNDQIGACTGSYGNPEVRTPYHDWFSKQSITFQNVLSPSYQTRRNIGSLLTGLYSSHHKIMSRSARYDKGIYTLANILRSEGYRSLFISNKVFTEPRFNLSFDFDNNVNCFFDMNNVNKKTFINNMNLTLNRISDWLNLIDSPSLIFIVRDSRIEVAGEQYNVDQTFENDETNELRQLSPFDEQNNDRDLGNLITFLRGHNAFENSIIIVSGTNLLSRDIKKVNLINRSFTHHIKAQIVLFIKFPERLNNPKIIVSRISALDITPTIKNYLGIEHFNTNDGISFLPLLFGPPCQPQKQRYIYIDGLPTRGSLFYGDLKMDYIKANTNQKEQFRCYDLKDDPLETKYMSIDGNYSLHLLKQEFFQFIRE